MNKKMRLMLVPAFFVLFVFNIYSQEIDPTSVLWYTHPADKWENALPVGNGRLGAMVFGRTGEEKIQFNEETYWSGGPYNQTRKGGAEVLPEIQKLIFAGKYIKAHKLFGHFMMGYPVEQMKYQSFGDLILKFPEKGEVKEYFHSLDLDKAVVITSYRQNRIKYKREVFVSPVDEVIVVRITYLGVEGKLRYEGRLKALSEGGTIWVDETDLKVSGADAVTLYIAAATNFVDYRDVSANPDKRVKAVLKAVAGKGFDEVITSHLKEHQRLFRRVSVDLGSSPDSFLPTDERLAKFTGENDPALAALCLQFGRYLLISSSRAGTQPANLQGIWNQDMNPSWDSKYTTNINTEMNYWPAEIGNLSECTEPLIKMIKELTVQGREVAREHYGAEGWVFHQNTDLWRVAAPMDGPDWGAFTTGGAWLCTHLWEHYLFCRDKDFLRQIYPVLKGSVEFFLDFLIKHPKYGWLVTNPSTSPENFPAWPGNERFFDEVCAWMSPGTTICAGSTIDMQILSDLFLYVVEAADILGIDQKFRQKVLSTRKKLAPMQIGQKGDLQEWLEDWGQKEKSHRHISNLYGLFPGNQISARTTPKLAEGCRVVLEQRGLAGNGWSSAWKMACWARLFNGEQAVANLKYYIHNYVFDNLFAICSKSLQVDGSFGVSAAVAEMILQSHEDEIFLLPSLPNSWENGEIRGLWARGGFEVDIKWGKNRLISALILSRKGNKCRLRTSHAVDVYNNGVKIKVKRHAKDLIEFETKKDEFYKIVIFIQGAEL